MSYQEFIESKRMRADVVGFKPKESMFNPALFQFQRDIVSWALQVGRCAIFADCGMGKTLMQINWADAVCKHTGGKVLVLAPLAVAKQTIREANHFGYQNISYQRTGHTPDPITITNYEMLEHFNPSDFVGIVLDESSILKAYDGKTRNEIINAFAQTPYRLACTATPAPNDFMEIGNHSEFLGTMTRTEMLSMFFVHDGGETSVWRLKKHARNEFWRWVCSWACLIHKPSDLGYSNDDFILPELHMKEILTEATYEECLKFGSLVPGAATLQEQRQAKRISLPRRVSKCAELVNATPGSWVIWCELNDEASEAESAIQGAVNVHGSMSLDEKEKHLSDFASGDLRVLITKPSIAGFGMNWQHCHNMAFLSVSHSFEQNYQAIRRCWRFGQHHPVTVWLIYDEHERAIVENLDRKRMEFSQMHSEMMKCHQLMITPKRKRSQHSSTKIQTPGWL